MGKEIIFKNNVVQKEKRIKIPDPILDFLELKEGNKVLIILDTDEKQIIVKKCK